MLWLHAFSYWIFKCWCLVTSLREGRSPYRRRDGLLHIPNGTEPSSLLLLSRCTSRCNVTWWKDKYQEFLPQRWGCGKLDPFLYVLYRYWRSHWSVTVELTRSYLRAKGYSGYGTTMLVWWNSSSAPVNGEETNQKSCPNESWVSISLALWYLWVKRGGHRWYHANPQNGWTCGRNAVILRKSWVSLKWRMTWLFTCYPWHFNNTWVLVLEYFFTNTLFDSSINTVFVRVHRSSSLSTS